MTEGNKMSTQPIASRLKYVGGLEEVSPAVLRTAQMAYDTVIADAAAEAGGEAVFGPVGAGHSTGLVPDPGTGSSPQIDEILFNDADWKHGESVRRVAQFDSNNVLVPGCAYGGRVYDMQDEGIVADYLLNGALNGSPTNNAAVFQDILNALEPFDTVIAPPGYWGVGSDVTFPSGNGGLRFQARGGYSNYVRMYNGGTNSGTATPGILMGVNGSTYFKNIWFWAGSGFNGGIAIGRALGSSLDSLEENRLSDCLFSSFGGAFFGCAIFDGTGGATHYGARRNVIENTVFHGFPTGHGLRIGGNEGAFSAMNVEFVGSASIAELWLLGSSNNSNAQGLISGHSLGNISMDWTGTTYITCSAIGNITITSNCASCKVDTAFLSGTFTNGGAACRLETPLYSLLVDAASDGAAAGLGVEVGALYRDGNTVKVRIA